MTDAVVRDLILGYEPKRREVQAFGTTLTVQEMSGATYFEYAKRIDDTKDTAVRMALAIVYSVVDAHGNLVFTPDDVEALARKPVKELDRVSSVAVDLSMSRGESGN